MQIIPDGSIATLEITNQAANGLNNLGSNLASMIDNAKRTKLAAAREALDAASLLGDSIAQGVAQKKIFEILGTPQSEINNMTLNNMTTTGVASLNNIDPETQIALANGLITKDELLAKNKELYQVTGTHSEREAEIQRRYQDEIKNRVNSGDYIGAQQLANQAKAEQSLLAQTYKKNVQGTDSYDYLKGIGRDGGGGKLVPVSILNSRTGKLEFFNVPESVLSSSKSKSDYVLAKYGKDYDTNSMQSMSEEQISANIRAERESEEAYKKRTGAQRALLAKDFESWKGVIFNTEGERESFIEMAKAKYPDLNVSFDDKKLVVNDAGYQSSSNIALSTDTPLGRAMQEAKTGVASQPSGNPVQPSGVPVALKRPVELSEEDKLRLLEAQLKAADRQGSSIPGVSKKEYDRQVALLRQEEEEKQRQERTRASFKRNARIQSPSLGYVKPRSGVAKDKKKGFDR